MTLYSNAKTILFLFYCSFGTSFPLLMYSL